MISKFHFAFFQRAELVCGTHQFLNLQSMLWKSNIILDMIQDTNGEMLFLAFQKFRCLVHETIYVPFFKSHVEN